MRTLLLALSPVLWASVAFAAPPDVQTCDLDVLYIQRTPKYPGFQPQYGVPGHVGEPLLTRKTADGKPVVLTASEVAAQQRWPAPGEIVTYTAVIENKGTRDASPFEYAWYLDGIEVASGKTEAGLKPGARVELTYTWPWTQERHELVFWADPMRRVRQYSFENDRRSLWTHAKLLNCQADSVTYASFAASRNFLGTYSFEDWCQAHADWMNHLFENSVYPGSVPDGILDRIAIDYIGVLENDQAHQDAWRGTSALKEGWDGAWWFGRREDCTNWAANMDWGLIHEWGHQLGLTDLYQLDVAPENNLVSDADGSPLLIGHHCSFAGTMMHGHGPVLFSEDQAIALNHQLWRRRGYYGDYYYNLAKDNFVRVLDQDGQPVANAEIRLWQRNDDHVMAGEPTFTGQTGPDGRYQLPNQPAPIVVTYGTDNSGYTERPNPFGLINVVGGNGVFFVEIAARGQTEYAFLEIPQFNVAKERQSATEATVDIATQLPLAGAPAAPATPEAAVAGQDVTLTLPGTANWMVLRADPTAYEWHEVGQADGPTYADRVPRSGLYRYAAVVERNGKQSARSAPVGVAAMSEPWGLAVAPDGTCYVRDRANGQTLLIRPDGSAVGYVGSVHWHLEGSYDHATDAQGRLYIAKWPDGYDPQRSWIRRIDPRSFGREHDRRDLAGGPIAETDPGRFQKPMGIWVAPEDGTIVVADTGNNRVQILNADGAVQPNGVLRDLHAPHKALLADGQLVVCDTDADRVVVYQQAQGAWQEAKVLDGFKHPVYACRGPAGQVWIADQGNGRIVGLDTHAWQRLSWSVPSHNEPPIKELRGIAYEPQGDELLYVDGGKKCVVRVPRPH